MTTDEKRLALQKFFITNPNTELDLDDTVTGRFDIDELVREPDTENQEDLMITHLRPSGFIGLYIYQDGDKGENDVRVSYATAPNAAIEIGYTALEKERANPNPRGKGYGLVQRN